MKKIGVLLIIGLLLCSGLAAAGFWDKITGHQISLSSFGKFFGIRSSAQNLAQGQTQQQQVQIPQEGQQALPVHCYGEAAYNPNNEKYFFEDEKRNCLDFDGFSIRLADIETEPGNNVYTSTAIFEVDGERVELKRLDEEFVGQLKIKITAFSPPTPNQNKGVGVLLESFRVSETATVARGPTPDAPAYANCEFIDREDFKHLVSNMNSLLSPFSGGSSGIKDISGDSICTQLGFSKCAFQQMRELTLFYDSDSISHCGDGQIFYRQGTTPIIGYTQLKTVGYYMDSCSKKESSDCGSAHNPNREYHEPYLGDYQVRRNLMGVYCCEEV